jgi:hypothetical protein
MQENFKDILGYEGIYQVSNLGNVKSLAREILKNGKYPFVSKERILKPSKDGGGYYQVSLFKEGKAKRISVHVLVAMTWLGHIPDGTQKIVVDHINNDKLDNRLQNLQLISNRENTSKDKKNGSSQYTGVSWHKKTNKWIAYIAINDKRKHLGLFQTEKQAHLSYQKSLKMYNEGDLSFIKTRKKSSEYTGVYWGKHVNKWVAYIRINGKLKHLGLFENEYEAHLAYQNALNELNK